MKTISVTGADWYIDSVLVPKLLIKGYKVNSNVIVGIGAVVTQNVPDGAVVAGNPAKIISTVVEVMMRKESSVRMIPHQFQSNLVENDEDAEVAKLVKEMYKC